MGTQRSVNRRPSAEPGMNKVNVCGSIVPLGEPADAPPSVQLNHFFEIDGSDTIHELRGRCVAQWPELEGTEFELVGRSSPIDNPAAREDYETIDTIWEGWKLPLCVMHLALWPLKDGVSTFPEDAYRPSNLNGSQTT